MAARRRYLNLSQRQLGAAIGVHEITVWRTENGVSQPTLHQMLAAARALGTPLHDLYDVTEPDEQPVG